MNTKFIICIAATLFITSSCKKDESPIEYPHTLKGISITNKSKIRLFSDGKEIKESSKIKAFIQESEMLISTPTDQSELGFVTFINPDSAHVGADGLHFNVIHADGKFFFYQNFMAPLSGIEPDNIPLSKYYQNTITPYGMQYRFPMVAQGSESALNFYCLAYKLSRNTVYTDGRPRSSSKAEGRIFNELNEDYVKSLGVYDTLAIQTAMLKTR